MKFYYPDQRGVFIPFMNPIEIFDEAGNVVYRVKRGGAMLGYMIRIFDAAEQEAAAIRQKVLTFAPKTHIIVNGKEMFVKREMRDRKFIFAVIGTDWTIEGDFDARCYEIKASGQPIARVDEVFHSIGKCCEVETLTDWNEMIILALVFAVEAEKAIESDGD